jgi:oligogalacturonide lyase
VVNADETLVVGIEPDPDAAARVKELGLPMLVTADLVRRDEPPGRLRPGGRSLALVVTDVKTGAAQRIHYSTEWLNHLRASPADPHRLLFCHDGAWHQVDRVWTIGPTAPISSSCTRRTMPYEIAGHGSSATTGVGLVRPADAAVEGVLAGRVNVETGERVRYPVAREHWSVHYNVSRDGKLVRRGRAGRGASPTGRRCRTPSRLTRRATASGSTCSPTDTPAETTTVGGGPVKVGKLAARRLVDLSKHDYALEPNVTITPDNKWVVFRSNMHGATHVYAVEVAGGR